MTFGSSVSHRPMESDSIDAREGARTAPERARVWCEAVLTKELARTHQVSPDVVRGVMGTAP